MFITWIVVGLFIGWLTGILTDTEDSYLINLALSVLGAIMGGILEFWLTTSTFALFPDYKFYNIKSALFSFIGSILLVSILTAIRNLYKN